MSVCAFGNAIEGRMVERFADWARGLVFGVGLLVHWSTYYYTRSRLQFQ